MRNPKHQSGTVLLVVIMLLLLATVLSFFALNVGVFEQRTSGNDVKAKVVGEIADAGLSQGIEFMHQHYKDITDTSKWTQCTATDTSFPCGSVPSSRRATMYYWSSVGYDYDGNGTISGWEQRMLPLPTTNVVATGATSTGTNFTVQYGVGAVLCRLATKTAKSDATTCTDSASATNSSVVTIVSTASIPSEGAHATVLQSIGTHNIVNNLPNTPPIVASGSINLVGTIQIVTNPNAGGTGVPVSLWTPQSLNGNGTGNSCYANEFYSSGGTVDWSHVATLPTFPLCDDCSCNGSLSYAHGNTVTNGIDSLSGDDNSATGGNGQVHVYADQTKTEFPCDLFQQIFGVQAWSDTSPVDGFCETHIMTAFQNPSNTSQYIKMGVDEAYLYSYAGYILANASRTYPICTDSTCAATVGTISAAALRTTSQTVASQSGLVWCQDGSLCATGTVDSPVLMVFDGGSDGGSPNLTNSGNIYGMVFGRSTGKATSGVLSVSTGGDASFSMSGNGVVYGSIVLQGTTSHLNGTSAVVYNKDILNNLANSDAFVKFGGMPASWSDRVSY